MKPQRLFTLFALCLLATTSIAQEERQKPQLLLGATLGVSRYFEMEEGVLVSGPERRSGGEGGFNLMMLWPSGYFIKTHLEGTDHRSAFVNDVSTYENFFQVPVLFGGVDLWRFSERTRLTCSLGPRFSLLTQRGEAGPDDRTYTMQDDVWGKGFKTGIVTEIAVYHRVSSRVINAYGYRVSRDITGWSGTIGSNGVQPLDRYVMGTFFLNVNLVPGKPFLFGAKREPSQGGGTAAR